jgi:hypothetical protein
LSNATTISNFILIRNESIILVIGEKFKRMSTLVSKSQNASDGSASYMYHIMAGACILNTTRVSS